MNEMGPNYLGNHMYEFIFGPDVDGVDGEEKEYVYVPYYPPYYQYPSYRYPEIKWYSNCGGSLDNATITTRTTSGYSQVI